MSEDAIRDALTRVFRKVLRDETLVLHDELGDFDSVAYIALIAEIEKEFQFYFSTREIHRLSTVGDFVGFITSRYNAVGVRRTTGPA